MLEVLKSVRALIIILAAVVTARRVVVDGPARGARGVLRIAALAVLAFLACQAVTLTVAQYRPGRLYWALEVK